MCFGGDVSRLWRDDTNWLMLSDPEWESLKGMQSPGALAASMAMWEARIRGRPMSAADMEASKEDPGD